METRYHPPPELGGGGIATNKGAKFTSIAREEKNFSCTRYTTSSHVDFLRAFFKKKKKTTA